MRKTVLVLLLVFSFCFGNKEVDRLLLSISSNNCKEAKEILNKNPNILSQKNSQDIDALEALFGYYYSLGFNNLWQNYDFHCFLDLFLKQTPNLNFYIQEINMTPLMSIVYLPISDKIEILDKLIKSGANIKQIQDLNKDSFGVIYPALYYKDLTLMDYLLKNGASSKNVFGQCISTGWLFDYQITKKTNVEIKKLFDSKKFLQDRKWYIECVDTLLKYYNIETFSENDVIATINLLIYINDTKILKRFIDLGILNNKKHILDRLIDYANKNQRYEMVKILKD